MKPRIQLEVELSPSPYRMEKKSPMEEPGYFSVTPLFWVLPVKSSVTRFFHPLNCLEEACIIFFVTPIFFFSLWFFGRRFHKYQYNFPESDPDIVTYDTLSLEAWLNSQTSNENCKDAVRNWFLLIENLPPDLSRMSTLYASLLIYQRLFSILASGLFLSNTFRWKDGTGTFIEHLTQHLDSPIFPHEPVTSILQSSSSLSTFHGNPYHVKV